MSISVIIPCFNEKKNLNIIIKKSLYFLKLNVNSEIILVNNGSTDETYNFLKKLENKKTYKCIKFLNINKNIGYGHGIKEGLKNTSKNYIAWTHADLQSDILDIHRGFKLLNKKKDSEKYFIKGKRINRNKFDYFFTYFMSLICSLTLNKKFHDINAQPKIFHKKFLKKILTGPNDFNLDLFTYNILLQNGLLELNIPVNFRKRRYGISKGGGSISGKIKLSLRTLKYIFNKY